MRKIKKTLITSLAVLGLFSTLLCGCAKGTPAAADKQSANNKVEAATLQQAHEYNQFQDFFTPAFQLIWNDFSDKLVKGNVVLVGGNPDIVNDLNKKRLKESMVSKNDLYKTIGKQTFATKKKIEKELKRKFHEKSNLLESIEWTKKADDRYVLYAMFKKDVLFSKAYMDLNSQPFNNSKDYFKYFGVTTNTENYKNFVSPVYYNNSNDFAVKLATKSGDEIILVTDNTNRKVFEIWDDFYQNKLSKKTNLEFDSEAELIIPQIDFKKSIKYDKITGKRIVNTNLVVDSALEDIEFSLDKNGAKIRNEAVMSVTKMALFPEDIKKIYKFDKPFVLYIRSKNADVPYFALKIKDTTYLKKSK